MKLLLRKTKGKQREHLDIEKKSGGLVHCHDLTPFFSEAFTMKRKFSSFTISKGQLVLTNDKNEKKVMTFPYPVADVIQFPDFFVVRLEPAIKSRFNENVYGVDLEGKIAWQIARRDHVYEDSPYTAIAQEGELVKLFNWDGEELTVDPNSGRIIKKGYGK